MERQHGDRRIQLASRVQHHIFQAKYCGGSGKDRGQSFPENTTVDQDPYMWPPSFWEIIENPSSWGDMTSTGYNWIPEFHHLLVLPLFMTATLLAALALRKRFS